MPRDQFGMGHDGAQAPTVLAAFERAVLEGPRRIACADVSGEVDYAWLDAAASEVASSLASSGPVVAVACGRSRHLLAALLGVMRAGRAYLPLDTAQPLARQRAMLVDAGVTTVLSDATPEVADGSEVGLVRVGAPHEVPSTLATARAPRGSDAAYVIFTSGSTGRPKGVEVSHAALAHCVARVGELCDFAPGEAWLALTAPSFDIAALELLVPLTRGGTVRLASTDEALDPSACARLLASDVDIVQATPTMWRAIVEAGWTGTPGLRVLCGGEAMDVDLARGLLARADRVWNMYGPTETTIWSAAVDVADVDLDSLGAGDSVPLGKALPGESFAVVGPDGRPEPDGAVGELWISGAGVAEGYVGDPERTADRFVRPDFAPDVLHYRTGDLARVGASGDLEFRGRADHQVKVRGHRIELGEVEAVIRRVDGVRECAVLHQVEARTGDRLVALVYGEPAGGLPAVEAACRRDLPEVMVPSVLLTAVAWPRLTSGKTDRAALAAMVPDGDAGVAGGLPASDPSADSGAVAQPGSVLDDVAAAYSAVLGVPVEELEHDADFFRLGGHSLMATRVVAILRARGHVVGLRDVFDARTVQALAQRVSGGKPPRATSPRVVEPPHQQAVGDDGDRERTATRAQRQFFLQDAVGDRGAGYHLHAGLHVVGKLDEDALRRALHTVVRRHPDLRTTYRLDGGTVVRRVAADVPVEVRTVDVPADLSMSDLEDRMRSSLHRPFDLGAGPLFRFQLYRRHDDDQVLHLCFHHIAVDGWAMSLLARQVVDAYEADVAGAADIPEVEAVRAPVDEEIGEHELSRRVDFHVQALEGCSETSTILLDHPRPAHHDVAGGTVRDHLDESVHARLASLAAGRSGTLAGLVLTVFASVMRAHGAPEAQVVAVPVAAREDLAGQESLGVRVETLLVPVDTAGSQPLADVFDATTARLLAAMEHAAPLASVVRAMGVNPPGNAAPVSQVALVVHNTEPVVIQLAGAQARRLELDTATSLYDLRLVVSPTTDGIDLQLDHATAVIDVETAELVLHRVVGALRALASGGDPVLERPFALPSASAPEPRAVPAAGTIHGRFAQQVVADPSAVAVSCGDRRVTRAQLDDLAARHATGLRRLGVRPGDAVGIALPRGIDLAAALLGVLRCGAAYVCLDATMPQSRLEAIAQAAGIGVVVGDAIEGLGLVTMSHHGLPDADRRSPDHDSRVDDVAYICFTSGSTGEPKGALIPHRAVFGFWDDVHYAQIGPSTVFLAHSSTSWDALTLELWPALLGGGRVHWVPEGLTSPDDVRHHLAEGAANTAWITSSFFNALVDADPDCLGGLDLLLTGGESLSVRHVRRMREVNPGVRLVNGYGPSECTVFTTAFVVPSEVPDNWRTIPIGTPVGDREVHVLDEAGQAAGVLVPGELWVEGPAVGLGYVGGRASGFAPDPTGATDRLWYRTGDVVRHRTDGSLEFVGRTDDQVKIRGFRIEPGEVEAALRGAPGVREGVVAVDERHEGSRFLVAFVVLHPTGDDVRDARDAVAAHLRDVLPAFSVPRELLTVPAVPRTARGKVDRAALLELGDAARSQMDAGLGGAAAAVREASSDELRPDEEAMARVWAEVLGRSVVGPDDNFFDLGGDSISAIQVVVGARAAGMTLEPRDVFEHQTVRAVTKAAGHARASVVGARLSGPVPLSAIQQWYFSQGPLEVDVFNQSVLLQVPDTVTQARIAHALSVLAERHDMLRARFSHDEQGWSQHVADNARPVVVEEHVCDGTLALAEVLRGVNRSLDIQDGRVLAAGLVDQDDRRLLLLVCHHLVVDGFSWRILLEDLVELLRADATLDAGALPPRTNTYGEWVEEVRRWIGTPEAALEAETWRSWGRSGGAAWGPHAEGDPATVRRTISSVLPGSVDPAPGRQHGDGDALERTMLAALCGSVAEATGCTALTVEHEHHGRDPIGTVAIDRTVGWFTTLYPLHVDTSNLDPAALAAATDRARRSVSRHGQGYGALAHLGGHDLGVAADMRFNYLGRFEALEARADGFQFVEQPHAQHSTAFAVPQPPLNVTALHRDGAVHVHWDFDPDRLGEATVRGLVETFDRFATALGSVPTQPTPALYPSAQVSQAELDSILEDL